MSQDEFTKLFQYMQDFREEVNEKLDAVAEQFDEINNRFDGVAEAIEKQTLEDASLTKKVERHDDWLHQLADKTSTDLAVEA